MCVDDNPQQAETRIGVGMVHFQPGDQHHSASTEHWCKSARSLELGLRVMPAGHNALVYMCLSVCVCVCVCVCVHTYTYMHVCVYLYVHTCIGELCVCILIYTYMYAHIFIHV